jgi:site-specific DNA-cytosine methylase
MDALEAVKLMDWDLMIAHPPCTFLSTVANRWYTDAHLNSVLAFEKERRLNSRKLAVEFVAMLLNASIDKIAIENPVGVLSSQIKKPNQIVHPYYFGDPHQKQTCLWLKNLPKLKYEKSKKPDPVYYLRGNGKPITFVESLGRHPQRAKLRSKTFPGIARAMAEQWG